MTDGGTRDAIRAGRNPGVLSDEDWAEVENFGVLDVLFVETPGSGLISAVVVLSDGGDRVHCWPLAERRSTEEAHGAAQFLLRGLAELRRRTRQAYPWVEDQTDGPIRRGDERSPRFEAISKAVDDWCRRFQGNADDGPTAMNREKSEEERRRRAAAGWPVREARKRWSMTQADLAARAGIQVAALSEIERGLRVPTPDQCARLAEALDADPEKLFAIASTGP